MNKIDDYFYSLWFLILYGVSLLLIPLLVPLGFKWSLVLLFIISFISFTLSYYLGFIKKHKEEEEDETYNNGG